MFLSKELQFHKSKQTFKTPTFSIYGNVQLMGQNVKTTVRFKR